MSRLQLKSSKWHTLMRHSHCVLNLKDFKLKCRWKGSWLRTWDEILINFYSYFITFGSGYITLFEFVQLQEKSIRWAGRWMRHSVRPSLFEITLLALSRDTITTNISFTTKLSFYSLKQSLFLAYAYLLYEYVLLKKIGALVSLQNVHMIASAQKRSLTPPLWKQIARGRIYGWFL